jgi:DNA-binding MarR family transcriptional regulator
VSSQPGVSRAELIAALSQQTGRDLATKTVLFHAALAARLGLSATDLKCLDLLNQAHAPLTASNLAALTGLTGGAITGVADRLEAAGFVARVRDPADRRRWELRPVAARQEEVAGLFAPLGEAMTGLCAGYRDGELAVITDFLTQLGRILDDQAQSLREPGRPQASG